MIHELLSEGRENARTGKELANYFKCDIRAITEQIETERRDGFPICAASGENPGYYLPADAEELAQYCDRLKGRAIELFKTRQALIRVLRRINTEREALERGQAEHGKESDGRTDNSRPAE